MQLNHTIIPAHDKVASAKFFADILDLQLCPPMGPFAPVRVNDALTLDFAEQPSFESHHYAFQVTEEEFDVHWHGGRGVYFKDPNGHLLELLTRA